ncbi:MAG: hypothetical protein LBS48_06280 [Treponema sp.]|jgi:hypothetical protein|nr:hypothetical protein [Treponema sp.]
MILKRMGALLVFSAVLLFPLSASMVSFLVIETGLQQETFAGEYSTLWEDGLMGVFFDAGHIVSNGTILRLEKTPARDIPDEALPDFAEASEGGAEYLVLILLDYQNKDGTLVPRDVSLKLFTVAGRKMIYQQRFAAGTSAHFDDEYARAREAARAILPYLKDR